VVFAGIVFGPLGPVQHIRYADARVRVDVAYRIAPDARFGSGEAAVSPSIATGSVTLVVGGVRRVVDFAALFPIHEHRIILSREGTCGTGAPVSRQGAYLAVEAVLAEKGCAAVVAVIDLDTGAVLERAALDHPSSHRFDARPQMLVGEPLRVKHAQLLRLPATSFQQLGPPLAVPWWVVVVRAVDARARPRELAYCALDFCAAGGEELADAVPRTGSDIVVGALQNAIPFTKTTMLGEPVVRLSSGDEARFEARQTPVPASVAQNVRRNSWFFVAYEAVAKDDFDAAVAAMEQMVAIDRRGPSADPSIAAGDERDLAACRALLARLHAGTLTKTAARPLFEAGCAPITTGAPAATPSP
jgi:hypothetical protein